MSSEGIEQVDPGKSYIYMFNHSSLLDHFILASQIPGFAIGLEKAGNFKIPLYGWVTKWWGNVPIVREDRTAAIRAIEAAQKVLAEGVSICVAPEGTRTKDGLVGPFKKGGFHMAVAMGVPIVPVTMLDVRKVNPDCTFTLRSGKVRLVVHRPVVVSQADSINDIAVQVRDQICSRGLAKREDSSHSPTARKA